MIKKYNFTSVTGKLQMFGEDELGIRNQGRFMYSLSFSQETGAIGQQTPRNGVNRPKLDREFSVRMRVGSDSTPHFFFQGCK